MMHGNTLLALLAAGVWGGGDFSGGMAVKHIGGSLRGALRVILLSHAMSFAALLVLAFARGDVFPHGAPLYWGLTAGVAGGLSLACFYIALSRGAMGASAALSGLLAAAVPAVFALRADGSPGTLPLAGFALAGLAIWMIAAGSDAPMPDGQSTHQGTFTLASVAGAGFGIYFIALKFAGTSGLVWPMATARMGSLSVSTLLLAGLSFKRDDNPPLRIAPRVVAWAFSTALLDTSGNMLFIAATRAGRLDVAAVLASLYPASTIVLAAWTLGERLTRRQSLGMAVAACAVVLITR